MLPNRLKVSFTFTILDRLLIITILCHFEAVVYHKNSNNCNGTGLTTSLLSLLANIAFKLIDIGGYRTIHRVLKDYYPTVDAAVFVINANDREHFKESAVELAGLLAEDQLGHAPVLILGIKTHDIPGVACEDKMRQVFGLHNVTTGKGIVPKKDLQRRPVELFMCSVPNREDLGNVFKWLAQYLD